MIASNYLETGIQNSGLVRFMENLTKENSCFRCYSTNLSRAIILQRQHCKNRWWQKLAAAASAWPNLFCIPHILPA